MGANLRALRILRWWWQKEENAFANFWSPR